MFKNIEFLLAEMGIKYLSNNALKQNIISTKY